MNQKRIDEIRARCEGAIELIDQEVHADCYYSTYEALIESAHDIPDLLDALEEVKKDRDRWKARAEALERAYKELIELRDRVSPWCLCCVHWNELGNEREHVPSPLCANCRTSHCDATHWRFDEARFAGG